MTNRNASHIDRQCLRDCDRAKVITDRLQLAVKLTAEQLEQLHHDITIALGEARLETIRECSETARRIFGQLVSL